MGWRSAGGVLGISLLLGIVAMAPGATDAAAVSAPAAPAQAGAAASPAVPPLDTGPVVQLLVAGLIGSMGLLARDPAPQPRRTRR